MSWMRLLIDANLPRSSGSGRSGSFADVRLYLPEQYAGVVVFRVPDDLPAAEIVRVAVSFFQNWTFTNNLAGLLAIVEPDRGRFRPALAWIAVAICFPIRQSSAPGSRCAMCSPAQGIDQRYREPYSASQRAGVPVGVYG